jgi:hypothetical protein
MKIFTVHPERYWHYATRAIKELSDKTAEHKIPALLLIELGLLTFHPQVTNTIGISEKFIAEYSVIYHNLLYYPLLSILDSGSAIINKSLKCLYELSTQAEFRYNTIIISLIQALKDPEKPNKWFNLKN